MRTENVGFQRFCRSGSNVSQKPAFSRGAPHPIVDCFLLPSAQRDPANFTFSRRWAKIALTDALGKPGALVEDVFSATRRTVASQSSTKDIPHYFSNAIESFRFTPEPPPPPVKQEPPVPPKDLFVERTHANRNDRQEYAYIPPGEFLMGCVKGDQTCEAREKTQHPVTITQGFWMGVTETTVDAYQRWVDVEPKVRKLPSWPTWNPKKLANVPIANVSWEQASTFCNWVGGRLPTEAEWEYAARAGKENEAFPLNSENARDKANFAGKRGNDKYEDEAAPPKKFDPDPKYGLYDMSGNLWEWTGDYFDEKYYETSPGTDPKGPATGKERVARGGSFFSDPTKHLRIWVFLTKTAKSQFLG